MGSQKRFYLSTTLAAVLLAAIVGAAMAMVNAVERVSTAAGGVQANGGSANCDITPDGHFIVFQSDANNLVTGDTNGATDIFRKDRITGDVVRVSVADDESQSNGASTNPAISDDGTRVAFASSANNLVTGDTNVATDIFVRDLTADTTQACSVGFSGAISSHGAEGPAISGDGVHVTYLSSSNNMIPTDTSRAWNIYMRHLDALTTERVSLAADESFINSAPRNAVCSTDGRYVAFQCSATNVVVGDTNSVGDIFVRDRTLGTTIRVSVSSAGVQSNGASENPSMSDDGRYVAFHSFATNLSPADTNGLTGDVFVRDTVANTTEICSISDVGTVGNGFSWFCNISRDGRFIAFRSDATNLVAVDTNGATDVFVRDRINDTTERVSVAAGGVQANGASQTPCLDLHGLLCGYDSVASNLVTDTNGARDVFVAMLAPPVPTRPSGLTVTPTSSLYSLQLNWIDNSTPETGQETGFRVERKTGGGAFGTITTTAADVTSFLNTGLMSGVSYTYRIIAVSAAGDSAPSNEVTASPNLPGAPTSLTGASINSSFVDLAWVDNFAGETGFQIWVSVDVDNQYGLVATGPANKVTYRHLAPTGNHVLYYKVRAVTATSQTLFSNKVVAYLMAAPSTLNSRALDSNTIVSVWKDNSNLEVNVELWRSVDGGTSALFTTLASNIKTYTDTSVSPVHTYSYKVRNRRGNNLSSFSNLDTSPAMEPPTEMMATAVASNHVDLSWVDNSGSTETSFQIFRSQGTGAFSRIAIVGANVTSYSDTTTYGGRQYSYKVRAAATSGTDLSSFSNTATVTTP